MNKTGRYTRNGCEKDMYCLFPNLFINECTECRYMYGQLASFPGHRRNGLASSNCYTRCQKVGNINQISERCHMTTEKSNCIMHWTVAVTPIPFQWRLLHHTSIGTLHTDRFSNDLYKLYITSIYSLNSWKFPGCFSYNPRNEANYIANRRWLFCRPCAEHNSWSLVSF